MRKTYVEELENLKNDVVDMGNVIESQLTLSMEALMEGNLDLAKAVIEGDREVSLLERKIEERCLTLILTQQPVASDLRLISATLKMITDMERIGSNARSISYFSNSEVKYDDLQILPAMADVATKMVHDAVDTFISEDIDKIKNVAETDDILDKYYRDVKALVLDEIRKRDVNEGDSFIELLMVSRYLERIGDHAVNIVDWIHFYLKGTHIKEKKL